jgi:hypothetical protein
VLIRQNGPVFGSSNPYARPGETQVSVSTRNLRSTDHYSGDVEQVQRQTAGTFVVNVQHMVDVNVTHVFTERTSISVGVPLVASSWGIPTPTSPTPGPRANQNSRGIGDISVGGRWWLLEPRTFTTGNIALGVGVKMPTGNAGYRDMYPDRNGQNNQLRFVDQSVQPGDGGWGLVMDLQGFRRLRRAQLFGSATYLANPRDRNHTTSGTINRLPPNTPMPIGDTSYNSVPDQFMARVGGAVPIRRTGLAASLAWRVEGVPRYDLVGGSHGFRRPGIEMFVEPGFGYAKGRQIYSVQVPIGYYRNRFPNPYTGAAGDATFPRYMVLVSYGYRFGSKAGSKGSTAICE